MTEIIWRQLRDTQFRLWKRVRKSGSCANWVNKEKSDKMENGDKNNFTCEKVEHEIASIAFTHSQYIRRKKQGEKISKKRVQTSNSNPLHITLNHVWMGRYECHYKTWFFRLFLYFIQYDMQATHMFDIRTFQLHLNDYI